MISASNATKKLLTLSMLKGIGPSTLKKVAFQPNFPELSFNDLALQVPVVSKALQEVGALNDASEEAERQIDEAQRTSARILSPLDEEYPPLLTETRDDPFLIFVRGQLAKDRAKSIAVIGTREPTLHGVLIAQRITQFLAEEQWSVVSGLALGCDAIAHQAALDSGGHTVAVLAHGLHTIAPARHRKLADDILTFGGALVSEFRFGQSAQPQQFVKRDRTQAGLAQGVVMVQSDVKGGSLHASRAALEYGRWLAIPYPTVVDRSNAEPKVQANLMIADGSAGQKEELLRCKGPRLDKVLILRGREDYPKMVHLMSMTDRVTNREQGSLI